MSCKTNFRKQFITKTFYALFDNYISGSFTWRFGQEFNRGILSFILFILISKTEYGFFIAIIILTAVIYILYLKRNEIAKRKEDATSNEELEKLEKTKNLIIKINNGISIVVFILIFIGFMIYMGRKKYEYKNNFSYLTFIFGKVECKGTISNIDYSTSLKHVFK